MPGDTPGLVKPLLEHFQAARTAMQKEMEKAPASNARPRFPPPIFHYFPNSYFNFFWIAAFIGSFSLKPSFSKPNLRTANHGISGRTLCPTSPMIRLSRPPNGWRSLSCKPWMNTTTASQGALSCINASTRADMSQKHVKLTCSFFRQQIPVDFLCFL